MTAATQFLEKLLRRGESARIRGEEQRVRLPLSVAQSQAYHSMRDLAEAEAFRGELAAAANAGAVTLVLLPSHAWPRDVGAAELVDLDALGRYLGISLLQDRMDQAQRQLDAHTNAHPVVRKVLDAWSGGSKIRRAGPEAAEALLHAIQVVDARRGAKEDALIRRESIRLLGRSKKIEGLAQWIDLLQSQELAASGLKDDEVLASLGLFREPQPLLLAGLGRVRLADATIDLARPYLGLPAEAVQGFDLAGAPGFLVSIENKQTFHEMVRLQRANDGIVIYSGGMPSPAWMRAYLLLVGALPTLAPCYHFGDLDLGGFRIAGVIARALVPLGRDLRPWMMDPKDYRRHGVALQAVTPSRARAIQHAASEAGWPEVAAAIAECPGQAEQEALPAELPEPKSNIR